MCTVSNVNCPFRIIKIALNIHMHDKNDKKLKCHNYQKLFFKGLTFLEMFLQMSLSESFTCNTFFYL